MAVSSVIGALRVNLGLDSAQFSTGLDRARGRLGRFASQAAKVAAGMAATAGAAIAALGVTTVNAGAEIERLAQVANTLPAQFQGWAAGARSVGIEHDKLADILKDVNDRVGDFVQTGGGPMADFFEKIAPKVGVTAASFRNLSGADALQLYVSSLEKANVNQQDFTFYMEAMASDSTLLLPLLRKGGAEMQAYADRAEAMGAVMGTDMLASLREGRDALAEIRLAYEGVRNTIGVYAVPALQAVAAAAVSAASFFHQHADTIAAIIQQLAATAIAAALVFGGRYAVAMGVTAVRATMAAIVQTIALERALGATTRTAALTSAGIKLLSGALATLRGAIAGSIFGLLIIGGGYALTLFFDLVQAAGGFGNALSLLADVAAEIWDRIGFGASALGWSIGSVAAGIKASFLEAFEWILRKFADVTSSIADGVNGMFAKAGLDLGLTGMGTDAADAIRVAASEARDDAANRGAAAGTLWDAAGAPLESMEALRNAMVDAEDQAARVAEAGSNAGTAIGTANGEAEKKVKNVLDGLRKQYDQLVQTAGMTEAQVSSWQAMRDAGVSATSAIGREITRLTSGIASMSVLNDLAEQLRTARATSGMNDFQTSVWETQREAGVEAESANGRIIDGQMRQIQNMKDLKDATDSWGGSIGSALSEFITKGGSFKDVLGSILSSLADIVINNAFTSIMGATGGSGVMGNILGGLGIGRNANGTRSWEGGLTSLHERGGEIYNLPKGTQVIPHDISKRMADNATRARGGIGSMAMTLDFRGTTGDRELDARFKRAGEEILERMPAHLDEYNQRNA